MAVASAVYTGLDPATGLDLATAVVFVGLLAGLSLVVVSEGVPSLLFARRHRTRAPLRALPGSLVVALVVVFLSRMIGFHPGYAFGAVAGFHIAAELGHRERGRLSATAILSIVAVSLPAWVAWLPVQRMASVANPSPGILILEAALVSTFLLGLETAFVLCLPIRFVNGGEIAKWNRWVWAAMFAGIVFLVVHIVNPAGNTATAQGNVRPWVIISLSAFFALFTVGFWGYFRFRPERPRRTMAA
jgi:uncharacterized membrane protein YozB (DUF420 family)